MQTSGCTNSCSPCFGSCSRDSEVENFQAAKSVSPEQIELESPIASPHGESTKYLKSKGFCYREPGSPDENVKLWKIDNSGDGTTNINRVREPTPEELSLLAIDTIKPEEELSDVASQEVFMAIMASTYRRILEDNGKGKGKGGVATDHSILGKVSTALTDQSLEMSELIGFGSNIGTTTAAAEAVVGASGAVGKALSDTAQKASTAVSNMAPETLGLVSMGLVAVFEVLPAIIKEGLNWDEISKNKQAALAATARLVVAGLLLAPPLAIAAGASTTTVAAVSAASSGVQAARSWWQAAEIACDKKSKTFDDRKGNAAKFVKERNQADTRGQLTREIIKGLTRTAWTAVHTVEAAGVVAPWQTKVAMFVPTIYSIFSSAKKAFESGNSFDGSLVHQQLRGGRAPVVWQLDDMVSLLDENDEKAINRKLHDPSLLYQVGGQIYEGSRELSYFKELYARAAAKGYIEEQKLEKVSKVLDQVFEYDFEDFDSQGKYIPKDLPRKVTIVLEDLVQLIKLDKSLFLNKRANFNEQAVDGCSSIAKFLLNWNANAVYNGSISTVEGLMALKSNPSVVINMPEDTDEEASTALDKRAVKEAANGENGSQEELQVLMVPGSQASSSENVSVGESMPEPLPASEAPSSPTSSPEVDSDSVSITIFLGGADDPFEWNVDAVLEGAGGAASDSEDEDSGIKNTMPV